MARDACRRHRFRCGSGCRGKLVGRNGSCGASAARRHSSGTERPHRRPAGEGIRRSERQRGHDWRHDLPDAVRVLPRLARDESARSRDAQAQDARCDPGVARERHDVGRGPRSERSRQASRRRVSGQPVGSPDICDGARNGRLPARDDAVRGPAGWTAMDRLGRRSREHAISAARRRRESPSMTCPG